MSAMRSRKIGNASTLCVSTLSILSDSETSRSSLRGKPASLSVRSIAS